MQINSLAPSQITEAKPAVAAPAAPPPVKTAASQKPAAGAPIKKEEAKPGAAASAAKGTEGTKAEITEVKPTGEANAEGEEIFTLKVNGKEYKATTSEIVTLAQKAKGAEAAMKAKAEIEQKAADLLTHFDNDTYGLLVKRHGKEKAKEIAISMVKNLIAEEGKDPKDVELEEKDRRLKEYEDAEKKTKEDAEATERKGKQAALYKTMLIEIDKELSTTHLPKDKLTLTRVLNYLAAGKKANGQVWTIKDAVQAVEVEDMGHASYYAKQYVEGKLPSEKFRAIFGEDTFKKLNKEQIFLLKNADKKAMNGTSVIPESVAAGGDAPQKRPRTMSKTKGAEGISEREWRKQHGSLGGI